MLLLAYFVGRGQLLSETFKPSSCWDCIASGGMYDMRRGLYRTQAGHPQYLNACYYTLNETVYQEG